MINFFFKIKKKSSEYQRENNFDMCFSKPSV